jgi:hypothetical protein
LKHLRGPAIFVLLVGGVFCGLVLGQSSTKRLTELPQSKVYSAVLSQPGNPLLIINPHAYYNLDAKRIEFRFGVRNTGKKPIIGFEVEAYWDMGTGGTLGLSWSEIANKKILFPGQQLDEVDPEKSELVPITPGILSQLKFKDSPSRLLFFCVTYVGFKDRTHLDFDQGANLANFLSNNYWDKTQQ